MNTLNTGNPNCFVYKADELHIELLGGVRIDALDRMRVTINVSVTNRKHPQYIRETADFFLRKVYLISPKQIVSAGSLAEDPAAHTA